jgi:hypothetical protein
MLLLVLPGFLGSETGHWCRPLEPCIALHWTGRTEAQARRFGRQQDVQEAMSREHVSSVPLHAALLPPAAYYVQNS